MCFANTRPDKRSVSHGISAGDTFPLTPTLPHAGDTSIFSASLRSVPSCSPIPSVLPTSHLPRPLRFALHSDGPLHGGGSYTGGIQLHNFILLWSQKSDFWMYERLFCGALSYKICCFHFVCVCEHIFVHKCVYIFTYMYVYVCVYVYICDI